MPVVEREHKKGPRMPGFPYLWQGNRSGEPGKQGGEGMGGNKREEREARISKV